MSVRGRRASDSASRPLVRQYAQFLTSGGKSDLVRRAEPLPVSWDSDQATIRSRPGARHAAGAQQVLMCPQVCGSEADAVTLSCRCPPQLASPRGAQDDPLRPSVSFSTSWTRLDTWGGAGTGLRGPSPTRWEKAQGLRAWVLPSDLPALAQKGKLRPRTPRQCGVGGCSRTSISSLLLQPRSTWKRP